MYKTLTYYPIRVIYAIYIYIYTIHTCQRFLHTYSSHLPHLKSHNASGKYHTVHHLVTEMCTSVHISVTKRCFVGYVIGALWDLRNRSNNKPQNLPSLTATTPDLRSYLKFSFLLLLPDCSPVSYNAQACDGDHLHLFCLHGYEIQIVEAFYGRNDTTTCIVNMEFDGSKFIILTAWGLRKYWYLKDTNLKCSFKRDADVHTNHRSFSWANESINPNSKVHGGNMGHIWGRQDPDGPHVGLMKLVIWESSNGLAPNRRESITWTNDDVAYWCMFA